MGKSAVQGGFFRRRPLENPLKSVQRGLRPPLKVPLGVYGRRGGRLRFCASITEPNSQPIPGRGESRFHCTEISRRPKTRRLSVERISEPVERLPERDTQSVKISEPNHFGCRHEGKIPKKTPLSLANLFPPFLFSSREMGPAEQRQAVTTRTD